MCRRAVCRLFYRQWPGSPRVMGTNPSVHPPSIHTPSTKLIFEVSNRTGGLTCILNWEMLKRPACCEYTFYWFAYAYNGKKREINIHCLNDKNLLAVTCSPYLWHLLNHWNWRKQLFRYIPDHKTWESSTACL
jgi:hypothetical protein